METLKLEKKDFVKKETLKLEKKDFVKKDGRLTYEKPIDYAGLRKGDVILGEVIKPEAK